MVQRRFSVTEVSTLLGGNPDAICQWIVRKRMPMHKVGGLWKFLGLEVDQWIKGGHAGEDAISNQPERGTKQKPPGTGVS